MFSRFINEFTSARKYIFAISNITSELVTFNDPILESKSFTIESLFRI